MVRKIWPRYAIRREYSFPDHGNSLEPTAASYDVYWVRYPLSRLFFWVRNYTPCTSCKTLEEAESFIAREYQWIDYHKRKRALLRKLRKYSHY